MCVGVDLLPLEQKRPRTIGDAANRMQDLTFAVQSLRSIARWQAVHQDNPLVSVTLLRLAYTEQSEEVAGKPMNFSPRTIARWEAGIELGVIWSAGWKAGRCRSAPPV